MSTRLAPTAACLGTFVLLTYLTTAGVLPSHRAALPHTGRVRRIRAAFARPPFKRVRSHAELRAHPAVYRAEFGPTA